MGGLFNAADLGHGTLLFVLLLGGCRHDIHVMLLLCQMDTSAGQCAVKVIQSLYFTLHNLCFNNIFQHTRNGSYCGFT